MHLGLYSHLGYYNFYIQVCWMDANYGMLTYLEYSLYLSFTIVWQSCKKLIHILMSVKLTLTTTVHIFS